MAIDPAACRFEAMREADLDEVVAIEHRVYPFPWSKGIFLDCLRHDHHCRLLRIDDTIEGYAIMSEGAGEAHVLNVCVHPRQSGRGLGRLLMNHLIERARARRVETLFLEVRPSNGVAIALYRSLGFNEIGRRPGYYPAEQGREDALVMALALAFPS